eukprot:SAG31_NODE_2508_length_5589_cov_11.540073_7_plen_32_part_00
MILFSGAGLLERGGMATAEFDKLVFDGNVAS